MQNYFNYFTEIEEHFSRRRGALLMLSTLDWALIETWQEAGLPLEIVLRGIDDAFDRYDARLARAKGRVRRINGLAWCSGAVLESAQRAADASVAGTSPESAQTSTKSAETGFEVDRIAAFLRSNAARVAAATLPEDVVNTTSTRLQTLAAELQSTPRPDLEALDRSLSVLEEKLLASLFTTTSESDLTALREQAARELAPYRGKMGAVQIRQVEQQFLAKRLFEAHRLPRLSLFYMALYDS